MQIKPLKLNLLPKSPALKTLIGPSFLLLGLGLGSGELILWPYLTSNYGLGIMWGALLGITFQFFMNMEIERYALVRGESIFVGYARKTKWLPIWFILSTFLPWIWPGIGASSASILAKLWGIQNPTPITIGILILIGLVLTLGPYLYKTVEVIQKVIIVIGVPIIFGLSLYLSSQSDWAALLNGLIGKGNNYWFLPAGISLSAFLAALAYSGAGGNLNLAQSFYVKDKGYGMGKYAGKIKSILTGKQEDIELSGTRFELNPENIGEFKKWWKNINIEHFLIFLFTGAITMLLLGLLSYVTVFHVQGTSQDINFLFLQAAQIGKLIFPFAGTFFLLISAVMLFSTQLGVLDASSRIITENLVLSSEKFKERNIPKIYYSFLWLQILAGIGILSSGLTQPLQLIIIGAVLNAFAMFVHVGLTLWVNKTLLEKEIGPSAFRTLVMSIAVLFYGGFSIYTIVGYFLK